MINIKIHWDLIIHMDHPNLASRPNLVLIYKKKRTFRLLGLSVSERQKERN